MPQNQNQQPKPGAPGSQGNPIVWREGDPSPEVGVHFKFDPDDDISTSYMERRDNAISPETAAIMNDPEVKGNFSEMMKGMGKGTEETKAETGGMEQPWVDPIMAFSGSFGAGALLTKTIGKPLISGVLNALADYPIGQATELVAGKYPNLALPFNLAFGVTSGIFAQSKLEEAIVNSLTKRNIPLTEKTVQEVLENLQGHMKTAISNERGSVSKKPITPEATPGPKPSAPPAGEPGAVSKKTYFPEPELVDIDDIESWHKLSHKPSEKTVKEYKGYRGDTADDPIIITEDFDVIDGAGRLANKKFEGYDFIDSIQLPVSLQEIKDASRDMTTSQMKQEIAKVVYEESGYIKRAEQISKEGEYFDDTRAREFLGLPKREELNQEIINNFTKEIQGNVATQLERLTPAKTKVLFDITPAPAQKAGEFQIAAHQFYADTADLPQKAININFRNIESTDDIKAIIYQTSKAYEDEIQVARRGVISNEETAKLADNLGMDTAKLLSRRQGQAFNAEQAYAARNLLVSSAENMRGAAQRAIMPDASELDKFEFRKLLNLHFAIQSEVSGMTAEAGRALQQFRMKAASQMGMIQQIKESMAGLQSLERGGTTEDLAAAILTLDSVGKVSKVVSKLNKPSAMKMITEYWINSILSGPMTHAVNMTSNTLTALWQIPERALAAGIGKMLPGEAEIGAGEAFHLLAGIKGGFEDGFRLIAKTTELAKDEGMIPALSQLVKSFTGTEGKIEYKAAITGANMLQTPLGKLADKVGVGGQLARAADIIGETVRVPGSALQFEDAIFKGIGYRMELNARAFRMARSEGLEGKAMSDRVASLINDPPDSLVKASKDYADYVTYTKKLGEFGTTLTKLANIYPAARFVLPFIRTPTNIFKFAGERTPLALLSKSIRDDIMAGGAERDLALSKMALGSAVMALVGWQTLEGNITGAGPKDKALNDTWRRTGWQPYSVKVGDQYFSYARFEPMGTIMGIAADVGEIYGQYHTGAIDDDNALLYSGLTAISKNVANKTFLSGLTNFIETQSDPERYLPSYLQRLATGFIPNVLNQVNQFEVDPVFRQTIGLIDAAKAKIPGLSDSLPPRRNLWGEPIVREGGGFPGIPDLVSPLFRSSDKNSPIDEVMKKNNIGIAPVQKWINGVELTSQEYDRYAELAGNGTKGPGGLGLKDTLNQLIGDSRFKEMSEGKEGGKALIIKKYIDSFRDAAKGQLLQEFPELKNSIQNHYKEKQKKRIPQEGGGAPTFE